MFVRSGTHPASVSRLLPPRLVTPQRPVLRITEPRNQQPHPVGPPWAGVARRVVRDLMAPHMQRNQVRGSVRTALRPQLPVVTLPGVLIRQLAAPVAAAARPGP